MQQVVHLSGVVLLHLCHIQLTKKVRVLHGVTHCSRIMLNSVQVCSWVRNIVEKHQLRRSKVLQILAFLLKKHRLGQILRKKAKLLRLHLQLCQQQLRLTLATMQKLKQSVMLSLKAMTSQLRSHSGSSVVTAGLTISVTAVLITYLLPTKTLTYSLQIQKFTPILVVRLLSLLLQVQLLNLLLQVRRQRRKTLV